MATTASWFQNEDHARAGFVLAVEGTNLIYTTIADANGAGAGDIKAAWAGTDWASVTWRGGLEISGTMGQSIELFDPKIEPDSLTFILADEVGSDTNIAQTLVRMAASSATWTYLDADIDANDTSMTVVDTTNFASSGTLYVGNETIDYTGKTATTFTGLTRGKFNIWATNGGARWSTPHKLSQANGSKPIVSDTPTDSYNRGVALYLHHLEDGVWSTRVNAKLLWAGRIQSVKDKENAFHVQAKNFSDVISRASLLDDQFTGPLAEGLWVGSNIWKITIGEEQPTAGIVFVSDDLFSTAAQRTAAEVVEAINTKLSATGSLGASLTYTWNIGLVPDNDGEAEKYRVFIEGPSSGLWPEYTIAMAPQIWTLLGFSLEGSVEQYVDSGGQLMAVPYISHNNANRDGEMLAALSPAISYPTIRINGELRFAGDTSGTFIAQTNLPDDVNLPASTDGFMQVDDLKVVAVQQLSSTRYLIIKDLSSYFAEQGVSLSLGQGEELAIVREGDGIGTLTAKQIWWETGKISDLILRSMLSTGTSTFNHATYDVNSDGMAIGVPATSIDINSFVSGLGNATGTFFFPEPEAFAPLLASALAVSGQYIVWKNGKLTVSRPRFDGSNITAAWSLTEGNKGGDKNGKAADGRPEIVYSNDGLVNAFQLKYDKSVTGDFRRVLRVRDEASITSYGAKKTIEVDGLATGKSDAEDWVQYVAASGLALFSRPLTKFSRTYDQTRLEMVPTDTVSVSDDYMVDPVSGKRGITTFPGSLLGTRFNFDKNIGVADIVMLTDLDPSRIGPWAPSARVDDTAGGSGYASSVITLKANEYSHSSQGVDVDFFSPDDVIHIVELSPNDPANPVEWTRTIQSISGNDVTLTSALSSPAWNSALKYVIEHTVISGAVTAQKTETFLADDADNSTGDAANDAYLMGGIAAPVDDSSSTVTTQRFRRMPDTADDTGRPFSLYKYHDNERSLNNLLAHKTRNACPHDSMIVEEAMTGTSFTLVYGPIWVPFFSPTRNATVMIRGYVGAGTGTFRVYASQTKVTGASDTATTYSTNAKSVDLTTVATSAAWIAEAAIVVIRVWSRRPPGIWLTVEAKNSGANTTTFSSISVVEDGY